MFVYLNSLSWKRLSIYLSALFTSILLVGGQLFIALGYAHENISWVDALWPPFVIGFLVLLGCVLMPAVLPDAPNDKEV